MTIFLNLFIRSVIPKSDHSDIKYHMTLVFIFSVLFLVIHQNVTSPLIMEQKLRNDSAILQSTNLKQEPFKVKGQNSSKIHFLQTDPEAGSSSPDCTEERLKHQCSTHLLILVIFLICIEIYLPALMHQTCTVIVIEIMGACPEWRQIIGKMAK